MARQQQVSTFIVPEPASGVTAAPPKGKRDQKPFVSVPDAMVEDEPESHWDPAIDGATD